MKRRLLVFFVLFCLVQFFGCVPSEVQNSLDQANQLYAQNRLDEAISLYEDALRLDPGNKDIIVSLRKAKELMVSRYLDRARASIAVQPLVFDNLKKAQSDIDRAFKLVPDNQEARRLNEQLKADMDTLGKKAEALYSAASRAIETNAWEDAITKLREIKTFYPNYLDLPIKLSLSENSGVAFYLKEADKYGGLEQWDNAVKVLKEAQAIQPNNTDIAPRLKVAQSRHTPEYYVSKAEEAAKKTDWRRTLDFLNKASALGPAGATAQKAEQLQRDAASYFVTKAAESLAGQRLYAAYTNVLSAIEIKPDIIRDPASADMVAQLINAMAAKADGYEVGGMLGNAFVWYDKAAKISGGRRELLQKAQTLKDRIRQRVVRKIAVMDFTSPSNNPDAGKVMTDNLLEYLTHNSTGDVKILARDVLGSLLKEIELGQAGLSESIKAGKLKGTDVLIFGNVLNYNIENNKSEGTKVVNAVVGKKSIQNAAYLTWLSVHPKPSTEELRSAPPDTIYEDIRETREYKVGTYKKIATINVSFKLVDVEEGEVMITRTLKNNETAEDTYSEGVDFANVAYKQVNLPSDAELMGKVVEKSVADLGREVLSRFQNLQVVHSNSAQKLKKEGYFEKAIEKYVDAINIEELKNISSPVSENAKNDIEQLLKTL